MNNASVTVVVLISLRRLFDLQILDDLRSRSSTFEEKMEKESEKRDK